MKKTLLVLLLVIVMFMTSCSFQERYDFEQRVFTNFQGLELVFDNMMDESGHDEQTEIQYDSFSGLLSYVNGDIYVDSLGFNIPNQSSEGVYSFVSCKCQSQKGNSLSCLESTLNVESSELLNTLTIGEAVELLTSVNIDELILNVENRFNIGQTERIYISFELEDFLTEEVDFEVSEDITTILIDDDFYIYESTVLIDGIKLKLDISFLGDYDPQIFEIYIN